MLSPRIFFLTVSAAWLLLLLLLQPQPLRADTAAQSAASSSTWSLRRRQQQQQAQGDFAALPELGLPPVRVGSFNIQVFGTTKMAKQHVVSVLLRILERYDLVFIMEIRDSTGQAIKSLLQQLNTRVGTQKQYSMVISDRLGRTSSKEQYAFFYRKSIFRLVRTYQYDDVGDHFERPPYGALFDIQGAHNITRFGVLGLHAAPRDAFDELEALHAVQQEVKRVWQNDNLFVLGDFNADCGYLNRHAKSKLQLSLDGSLTWLITACMETTTVKTKCLYDHILATGSSLMLAADVESAGVFNFDRAFGLNSTIAEEVSDHYPVELLITGEMHKAARKLTPGQSLEVTQPLNPSTGPAALLRMQQMAGAPPGSTGGFRIAGLLDSATGRMELATATRDAPQNAAGALADFRAAFPGILDAETPALVAKLVARQPLAEAAPLPGYSDARRSVKLSVACSVAELQCTVRLAAWFAACPS